MEQNDKVELLSLAIQRLIQDNSIKESSLHAGDEDSAHSREHRHHLLSRLLSDMEELQKGGSIKQLEVSNLQEEVCSVMSHGEIQNDSDVSRDRDRDWDQDQEGCSRVKPEPDEITKELKKIKRQNFITHCLLSAMIILTLTWQISEVSLIFTLKERLGHPFKYLGRKLAGMLRGPDPNGNCAEKNSSLAKQESSLLPLPSVQTPEMPLMMQE